MKKTGFTLAEVLITLVIIGVIAALTIPTLMKANKRTETEARMKKIYSTMANAIKLSEVDNGSFSTWDFSDENAAYQKYFRPYLKFTKECTADSPCVSDQYGADGSSGWGRTAGWTITQGGYLADGSLVCFNIWNPVFLTIDIDGDKGLRRYGIDLFIFIIPHSTGVIQGLNDYGTDISSAETGCRATDHGNRTCGAWIMMNGWKIPDNYPWL